MANRSYSYDLADGNVDRFQKTISMLSFKCEETIANIFFKFFYFLRLSRF